MTASDVTLSFFLWHPALLALLATLFCALGAGLVWLLVHVVLRLGPAWAPQAPFHAAIIALFALILSFTANSAWRRNDQAYGALLREAQEGRALTIQLDALATSGQGLAPTLAPEARSALADYLRQSLREEWGGYNVRSSPAAGLALDRIRTAAATGMVAGGQSGPAWRSVQDRLDGMQQARTARLVAGGVFGDQLVWTVMGGLYLVASCATLCVHLERRRAGTIALAVLAVAAALGMSLVAMSEQPYAGWDAVTPDQLQALLQQLDP